MATSDNKSKTVAYIATALFLLSLSWAIFQIRTNGELNREIDKEKLAYESILAEKLSKDKEIAKINNQLAVVEGTNGELNASLHDQSDRLTSKEGEINRLRKEDSGNKKKTAELVALKNKLEQELSDLNNIIQQLQANNTDLNNSVAELQQRNQLLNDELQKVRLAYYDKPLVEAVRGKNDKLMAKASRTKKLRVTLMCPSALSNVQFRITDPTGKVLSASEDGTLATRIVNSNVNATASAGNAHTGETYNQIEMIFLPKRKLNKGVYQIEVINENLAVGGLQIRLR